MSEYRRRFAGIVVACVGLVACSGGSGSGARTGGRAGTGSGGASTGGHASGGVAGTGGASAGTGGQEASGGSPESGGSPARGGSPVGGGAGVASGGTSGAAGGSNGGTSGAAGGSNGGTSGAAGGSNGGTSGAAGGSNGGASDPAGGAGGGAPCGAPTSTCTCVGFRPPADHPANTDYDLTTTDVVVDKISGLTWERSAVANGGTMPCPSILLGCPANSGRADAHCVASRTGGFADWRLPTVLELTSITDFEARAPAVNAMVFPSTPSDYFWTSTPILAGAPSGTAIAFWTVDARDGSTLNGNPSFTSPVRCVRSAAATSCFPNAERYQPSPISSVQSTIDRTTGLTWQKGRSPQPLTWAAAKDYCATLGSRVPSTKELLSIVEFAKQAPPAIDSTAFPDTPSQSFWTVTAAAGSAGRAMVVDFVYGSVTSAATTVTNHVRCVR